MNTKLLLRYAPFAALLLLASCGGEHADHNMSSEHMTAMKADSAARAQMAAQEVTMRTIVDLFNTSSTEGVENLLTENFVDHQMDPSITTTGLQGVKDMMALYHTAFPDFKQEIIAMSTTGDRTYVHTHITGTNSGPWGAMPATNKAMDLMGVDIVRFENGKAAEHWGYMEEAKMMTQLGLMPPPGDEKKK